MAYSLAMEMEVIEAAGKLGVHPQTIRELCWKGIVPAEKRLNTKRRYTLFVDFKKLRGYLNRPRERKIRKCKPLSQADRGYIAGFLDGEGCLSAWISRTYSLQNGKKYHYWKTYCRIQISVIQEAPIRWLKEITGVGSVTKEKRRKLDRQDLFKWTVEGWDAFDLLSEILPYLKIKTRQAEVFQILIKHKASTKSYKRGKPPTTPMDEGHIRSQELIDELHALNQNRGKVRRKEFSHPQPPPAPA